MKILTFPLNTQSAKYWIFDLAVFTSFIAVGLKLLRGGNSPLPGTYDDCAEDAFIPSQQHQHQHQQQREDVLKIGELVQVFDPEIDQDVAFFGEISATVTHDDSSITYDILAGPNRDQLLQYVGENNIEAHQPLDYNSHAMCYFSTSEATPCTILSYSDDNRQYYYISAILNGKVRRTQLPISRVRPVIFESPDLECEFKKLHSSEALIHVKSGDSYKLQLSGVAEIHDDGSDYVAPLIITSYNGDFTLSLKGTFNNTYFHSVEQATIHPYHVYEDGTVALCKVGNVNTSPCIVESHSVTETGSISYTVSYISESESETLEAEIPFTNVQRLLKHKVGVTKTQAQWYYGK